MKKYILIILILLSPLPVFLQADNLTSPFNSIVPRPAQITPGSGSFIFSAKTTFAVENQEQATIAHNFIDLFVHAAGITPMLNVGSKEGQVLFVTDSSLKTEAYLLKVTPEQILIKASDTKGFFYALQSIRQLLPAAIESGQPVKNVAWSVPAVTIQDEPRFGFRGLLLDPVRCFIPKENVLRIIDCMAMLKINKLHFHLTDDNGWRIEIKKYPRLTEVGAWRVDRTDVPFHSRRNPKRGEPTPIGGFYTQEDIREIVAYAADRQIEVIPEIDVPAHSNAALAAYPQLACPVVKDFIGVLPGLGGRNSEIIYCAGNDSVFTFLQDIFDEILTLFPSRYIHVGGDEARKTNWEKCPLCQKRMKKQHLTNEEDLQGYFMKRISDYLRKKGREVIGWDELVEILREFKEKASAAGVKQFIIQTHFQTPLEVTPEAKEAIRKILSAGWIITNQLVYTVAASRRGHTTRLRQVLNSLGVMCYYTFSVKGFNENYAVFAPNSRSMQEQQEEKIYGRMTPEQAEELYKIVETKTGAEKDMKEKEEVAKQLRRFMRKHHLPFLATDRSVLNLPAIGKSMTFQLVGLTEEGKRILCFEHDGTRRHSPIIDRMGQIYIVENKSLAAYLRQLAKMGEDPEDYASIWNYTKGETETRFSLYEYPDFPFHITDKMSNLSIED